MNSRNSFDEGRQFLSKIDAHSDCTIRTSAIRADCCTGFGDKRIFLSNAHQIVLCCVAIETGTRHCCSSIINSCSIATAPLVMRWNHFHLSLCRYGRWTSCFGRCWPSNATMAKLWLCFGDETIIECGCVCARALLQCAICSLLLSVGGCLNSEQWQSHYYQRYRWRQRITVNLHFNSTIFSEANSCVRCACNGIGGVYRENYMKCECMPQRDGE